MDVSVFLAKALGTYFLIMCLSMLINGRLIKSIIIEMTQDSSLFFLTSVISLILGILLVLTHNVWVSDWRVVITIIAWLTLLKGAIRVVFPEFNYKAMFSFFYNTTAYYVLVGVVLVLGIFLSYAGFSSN